MGHLHVELVVLDHEHAPRVALKQLGAARPPVLLREVPLPYGGGHLLLGRAAVDRGEEELGAAAVDARHVDLPSHELDELLADGEAEAHTERVLDALVPDLGE